VSLIDLALSQPDRSRRQRLLLWLFAIGTEVREYFERWIYAQHNARVLATFEDRMVAVVYEATGGMMSKPYYTTEAMKELIREYHARISEEAYDEGRKDLADELGIDLTEHDA
jgi:hypothetical protein